MATGSPIRKLLFLIFLAASLLFMFFIVLSGLSRTTPLQKTYFLKADTSSISEARDITQWTYFYMCGEGNHDCGKPVPGLPLGYAWRGGGDNAPEALTGRWGKGTTDESYFFMWRFGWVFYLMGLVLAALAFIGGLLYCLLPTESSSSIKDTLGRFTHVMLAVALIFFTPGVILMTVVFVLMRNRFRDAGMDANIGNYAFGFSWAALVCLLLAYIFFFMIAKAVKGRRNRPLSSSGSMGRSPTTRKTYLSSRFGRNRRANGDVDDKETV